MNLLSTISHNIALLSIYFPVSDHEYALNGELVKLKTENLVARVR